MNELGFDVQNARSWFTQEQLPGQVLVRVSEQATATWTEALGVPCGGVLDVSGRRFMPSSA